MKRLLSVALMVLATLVGVLGVSGAATDPASAISNAVSTLQATANPTTGAVTEPPATVNARDVYSSPYYDSSKGAVIEPPAMVCTGRIDQLEGGCI